MIHKIKMEKDKYEIKFNLIKALLQKSETFECLKKECH